MERRSVKKFNMNQGNSLSDVMDEFIRRFEDVVHKAFASFLELDWMQFFSFALGKCS